MTHHNWGFLTAEILLKFVLKTFVPDFREIHLNSDLIMKKLLTFIFTFCLTLSLKAQEEDVQEQPFFQTVTGAGQMVRVVRWISPVYKDFESMPEGRHTDAQLRGWGFTGKIYQYSAYRAKSPGMIAVYRWSMPNCQSSIMLGEHEHSDNQLRSWGYKDKEFQFYAYRNKPASGDFVAVSRWINAKPQNDPCRDYTLSVAETEFSDQQLISWGYTQKTIQFWVPRPAGNSAVNNPVRNTATAGNWVRVVNGQTPANAMKAGKEADGTPLLIARVMHEGSLVIGKARQGAREAFFPYGGKEIVLSNYEVYCGQGSWVYVAQGSSVPPRAIAGGYEADGQPLYIARLAMGSGIHIGKARNNAAFIPFGGIEEVKTSFWVLVPTGVTQAVGSNNNASNEQTITLDDIDEWLCPNRLTRGDREFDGHGPRIKSEVKLRISNDGTSLWADITFWAQETQQDWSTAEGSWTRKVYDAPYGKRITAIRSDKASRTQFISPPGGFQFLVPGADVAGTVNNFLDGLGGSVSRALFTLHGLNYNDFKGFAKLVTGKVNHGNTAVTVPSVEGTLVKFFTIVGDTGGADISDDDNCNDDTRIVGIRFAPVRVEMRNQP